MSSPNAIDVILSIVIVNYKTPNLVTDCLETLLPELEGVDARVFIVDNNSEDNSCSIINEWLAEHDTNKKVSLIQSNTNAGFSSGNNIGIKALKARYYLLLNSDTLVRPGAIKSILGAANASPGAGLISPRLEWANEVSQESCFSFPGPVSEFCSAAQTGWIDRLLSNYIVALQVQSVATKPKWTSFACVLIRDEVFQQIGLMDERYFMFFEDVEYCHRARKAGWTIVNIPEARVVHLRGGSSPVKENTRQRKRLPRYYYESRALFYFQTYGWLGLTVTNLLWETGRLISKIRQILGRSDKAAIENQWLDIWTNWLNPLEPYTHPDSGK